MVCLCLCMQSAQPSQAGAPHIGPSKSSWTHVSVAYPRTSTLLLWDMPMCTNRKESSLVCRPLMGCPLMPSPCVSLCVIPSCYPLMGRPLVPSPCGSSPCVLSPHASSPMASPCGSSPCGSSPRGIPSWVSPRAIPYCVVPSCVVPSWIILSWVVSSCHPLVGRPLVLSLCGSSPRATPLWLIPLWVIPSCHPLLGRPLMIGSMPSWPVPHAPTIHTPGQLVPHAPAIRTMCLSIGICKALFIEWPGGPRVSPPVLWLGL